MAGEVVMKFSAEEGEAVRGILKILDAQKKMEDGFGSVRAKAKDTETAMGQLGEAGKEIGKGIVGSIAPALMNMTSVAGAIQTAFKLVQDQMELTSKRANEFHKDLNDMIRAASMAGQIKMLPELEAGFKEISGATMGEKRGGAIGLMSEGMQLDKDQILKSISFGAKAKEGGMDLGTAAQVFGKLSESFKDAPGLEAQAGFLGNRKIDDQEAKIIKQEGAGGSLESAVTRIRRRRASEQGRKIDEDIEGMIGADTSDVKQIKDAEVTKEIEVRKALRLELEKKVVDLEKESAGSVNSKKREIKSKIEPIRAQMHELSTDITELSSKEMIDDPNDKERKGLLDLVNRQTTPAAKRAMAENVARHAPHLFFKPEDMKAGKAFLGPLTGVNLVEKNRADLAEARESDTAMGESGRLEEELDRKAEIADAKKRDPRNLEIERMATKLQNDAATRTTGLAGELKGGVSSNVYRFAEEIEPGSSERKAKGAEAASTGIIGLAGGPLAMMLGVLNDIAGYGKQTGENTTKRGNLVQSNAHTSRSPSGKK